MTVMANSAGPLSTASADMPFFSVSKTCEETPEGLRPVARSNWLLWPTPQASDSGTLSKRNRLVGGIGPTPRAGGTAPVDCCMANLLQANRTLYSRLLNAYMGPTPHRPLWVGGLEHGTAAVLEQLLLDPSLLSAEEFQFGPGALARVAGAARKGQEARQERSPSLPRL